MTETAYETTKKSSCTFKYSSLPEIIRVDLPFFASSTEAAYATLGGEEKLKIIVGEGAKNVNLRFPSQNCLQGSLVGEKVSTGGGLLLRVRRRKVNPLSTSQTISSLGEDVTVTVLGRVDSAYVFNQPADYQFLPETSGLLPLTGLQDAQTILETIPRPFTRTPIGQQTDFLYKELNFDADRYLRKKRETGQYHQIKFGDPIPQELNADATKTWESTARTGTKVKIAEVKLALAQKLKEKPIWKKKQLDLYEPFKSLMYVYFEVLPLLTFGYISGPFKGYIVRYGYDASLHPESRFLQVVHYRMNKREFYNVKQRISDHVGVQSIGKCIDLDHMIVYEDKKYNVDNPRKGSCVIVFMGIEFKQQQSFQVCDLTDEKTMLFIQKMKRLEVCGKDGWFHLGAITIIRDKFREFVLQRIDEFLSEPRHCNIAPTDSTAKSSGIQDLPIPADPSDPSIDDVHVRNSMILCDRLKKWQDRYLALPDSGVASEAEIAAYQHYADVHRKKSGIKSHRLQRIFRLVGKSLSDPKNGRSKSESNLRSRTKRSSMAGARNRGTKRKKKTRFLDTDSDSEYNDDDENENENYSAKRVTFAEDSSERHQNSSSSRGPYSHKSASLNIENENDNDIENENDGEEGQGVRGGRGRGKRDKPAGSGSASEIGLDSVEAFSFFDDDEEEDDDDDDSDSDSGSEDEENGHDPDGVLDPFGTHEDVHDDAEYDEEDEEESKSRLKAYHSDSAWL